MKDYDVVTNVAKYPNRSTVRYSMIIVGFKDGSEYKRCTMRCLVGERFIEVGFDCTIGGSIRINNSFYMSREYINNYCLGKGFSAYFRYCLIDNNYFKYDESNIELAIKKFSSFTGIDYVAHNIEHENVEMTMINNAHIKSAISNARFGKKYIVYFKNGEFYGRYKNEHCVRINVSEQILGIITLLYLDGSSNIMEIIEDICYIYSMDLHNEYRSIGEG